MKILSAETIIKKLSTTPELSEEAISKIFRASPTDLGKIYSKSEILAYFDQVKPQLSVSEKQTFLHNITMKKTRTLSGVTTVTVLTKPFPCPGKCIFCPNDVRMPKSYIASEPGAQRAEAYHFDPYRQTYGRLMALNKIGHPADKVELIVLGGTWTAYTLKYQIWFIKRCFDAINDFNPENPLHKVVANQEKSPNVPEEVKFESGYINYNLSVSAPPNKNESATWDQLSKAHKINETAKSRCVGLSIETRPDEITQKQVELIRKLGATKVQIGVQSLDDEVLKLNKRGHDVAQTARAFRLLRQAGFKIQAHYMPNLYGSSPKKDIYDFKKLFKDTRFRPDEIKLYPCSLIDGTELMTFYREGKWRPYSKKELVTVLSACLSFVPRYCRITRVIRDIPSQEIHVGNKLTNLRQLVESQINDKKILVQEIRSREIKNLKIQPEEFKLLQTKYATTVSTEIFMEYVDPNDRIAGFLRLSLPKIDPFFQELTQSAIIREVHVYGSSVLIGDRQNQVAQHIGLGTKLVEKAKTLALKAGFENLTVISSIGTKKYYEKLGFKQKGLYQSVRLREKKS